MHNVFASEPGNEIRIMFCECLTRQHINDTNSLTQIVYSITFINELSTNCLFMYLCVVRACACVRVCMLMFFFSLEPLQ